MDVLAPTLPLPAMVERIAWTHPDFGLPLDLPDRPWTHETTAKGASLSWFTRSGARNGALTFWRVSLHVDRHHNADITRTTIPNPFLLKGSVAR
jgi:hypothetical protein